jgi:hypothetical protein
MIPSQKTGVACPKTAIVRPTWSARLLGRRAETTPIGIATANEKARAAPASSNVAGMRSSTSGSAGRFERRECPRSPRTKPAKKRP